MKNYPPKKLEFLDADSIESYFNLLKSLENEKLTLIFGAGISVSSGLPSWYQYLKKIASVFLIHWNYKEQENPKYKDRAPRNLSIAYIDELFQEELVSDKLIDKFMNEDALMLAQLIRNCIDNKNWKYLLRKALYGEESENVKPSKLLNELAVFIKNNLGKIDSIITYNFDDLIEHQLCEYKIKTSPIVQENRMKKFTGLPIYHPHGVLPLNGGFESKIYFSDEDYLSEVQQPFSWYNLIHTNKLTSTTCVFIGLSFNDPALKRLLATNIVNKRHYHYALLTHEPTEFSYRKFLLLKNELLRLNLRVIKFPYTEGSDRYSNLNRIIRIIGKSISDKNYVWK